MPSIEVPSGTFNFHACFRHDASQKLASLQFAQRLLPANDLQTSHWGGIPSGG